MTSDLLVWVGAVGCVSVFSCWVIYVLMEYFGVCGKCESMAVNLCSSFMWKCKLLLLCLLGYCLDAMHQGLFEPYCQLINVSII
jgi:hypothetical protein